MKTKQMAYLTHGYFRSKGEKMNQKSYEPLSREEWGKIYNKELARTLIQDIKAGNITCQTEEMLKITKVGDCVLEIGCGSGATSAALALNGRVVTAIDYSEESLGCAGAICAELGCNVKFYQIDASKELPFKENSFNYVFQAGLLEHFEKEKRIELLKIWGKVAQNMVSIIPNAASIAYRTGKWMMETKGTWNYGMELPQYTLIDEFIEAGFEIEKEYTIGVEAAFNFLPKRHYLRKAMEKWAKEDLEDICGQGYLLVTIGSKNKKNRSNNQCGI